MSVGGEKDKGKKKEHSKDVTEDANAILAFYNLCIKNTSVENIKM